MGRGKLDSGQGLADITHFKAISSSTKEKQMTSDFLCRFLLWCMVFNYLVLCVWFLAFVLARHWMFNLHRRWFPMPDATFIAIHYSGMAVYKIGILLFNLAPLVALYFMR
jgi:hypothetical protein